MYSTSNFNEWLDDMLFTDYTEVSDLYVAIERGEASYTFKCFRKGDIEFIKSIFSNCLFVIPSEKSRTNCISILSKRFFDGEPMEVCDEFKRALEMI